MNLATVKANSAKKFEEVFLAAQRTVFWRGDPGHTNAPQSDDQIRDYFNQEYDLKGV